MRINIDISDLINELSLPRNTADFITESVVEEITTEIYRNWRIEASNRLHSTRDEYLNALDIVKNSQFSRTIILRGDFPNALEKGMSPFDMKAGFQKSSKVKYSIKKDKNGHVTMSWYLTIPFRHATPGSVGENMVFTSVMPKQIHEIIKDKQPNTSIGKLPSGFDIPSSRAAISIPESNINFPAYTNKSSIYAGMVKKTGVYGNINQNSYQTFRRVSSNSDPNSWIHKGIQAYNLMDKALATTDIDLISENKVDEILDKLGYGGK